MTRKITRSAGSHTISPPDFFFILREIAANHGQVERAQDGFFGFAHEEKLERLAHQLLDRDFRADQLVAVSPFDGDRVDGLDRKSVV